MATGPERDPGKATATATGVSLGPDRTEPRESSQCEDVLGQIQPHCVHGHVGFGGGDGAEGAGIGRKAVSSVCG